MMITQYCGCIQGLDDSEPRYVGVQHSFWLQSGESKKTLVPGLESGTVMRFQPDDTELSQSDAQNIVD